MCVFFYFLLLIFEIFNICSLLNQLSQKIWKLVADQRRQWNLASYTCRDDAGGKLAQICQLPAEFDFPWVCLPKTFHYTGPLQDPSGLEPLSLSSVPFPFEKLNGKPLIYAALGTLQNRKQEIFQILKDYKSTGIRIKKLFFSTTLVLESQY